MKKNSTNLILTLLFLGSQAALFAQGGPGDGGDGGGGLEGGDPAPAPINTNLIVLAIVGLVFAFYQFKKHQKEASS